MRTPPSINTNQVKEATRRHCAEKLLLKIEDAAAMCSVARSTFYVWINQGAVPVIRMGRSVRIPRAWLEKWIDEQVANWEDRG